MTSFDLDAGAPQGGTFLLQHLLVTFPHDFSPKIVLNRRKEWDYLTKIRQWILNNTFIVFHWPSCDINPFGGHKNAATPYHNKWKWKEEIQTNGTRKIWQQFDYFGAGFLSKSTALYYCYMALVCTFFRCMWVCVRVRACDWCMVSRTKFACLILDLLPCHQNVCALPFSVGCCCVLKV